jgi:PAS domain S-box-containing protein
MTKPKITPANRKPATRRKRDATPDALASAQEKLRILEAGIPNAYVYVDTALVVRLANAELAQTLGKSLDEITGRPIAEVLGPDFSKHRSHLDRALHGEQALYEVATRGAAGNRHLRIASRPVHDERGSVQGVFAEIVDVTAQKKLEDDVRRSESRFRMLASGVPNHLLFLDRDLRIEFANDVFLEASGWSAETARGRHISEVVGAERFLMRQPYYDRALAGETVTYESTGAAGDAEGFFRFSYRPSFDADGEVIGIFSTAADISERRKIELALEAKQEELTRSNKDLEQFAYVASHDLKAPLRAIELLVQWIKEGLAGYDANNVQQNLSLLGRRTQRLSRLLDDLLAYSRAGRKVGDYRETDCASLVNDAIQLTNAPAGISVSIAGAMPTFRTYPVPLEQVLRNLIGNAVKHHPGPEGSVVVSCEDRGGHYLFSVADDGEGIPAEYAQRVFEMFQTLKPRDKVEGSGMGLAIVSRIVAWQGGRVWFDPNPTGRGTVFKFQWMKRAPLAGAAEIQVCQAANP